MTTPTLQQASISAADALRRIDQWLKVRTGGTGLMPAEQQVLEELEQAIEREKAKPQDVAELINDLDAKMHANFAMSPKPVSGTSSGRHCGSCKHDIHPMPSRCYKCGAGDLSNWESKP